METKKRFNPIIPVLAIGVGIGTALGVAFHTLALGIGVGVAIGTALGVGVYQQGKNEEKSNPQ